MFWKICGAPLLPEKMLDLADTKTMIQFSYHKPVPFLRICPPANSRQGLPIFLAGLAAAMAGRGNILVPGSSQMLIQELKIIEKCFRKSFFHTTLLSSHDAFSNFLFFRLRRD